MIVYVVKSCKLLTDHVMLSFRMSIIILLIVSEICHGGNVSFQWSQEASIWNMTESSEVNTRYSLLVCTRFLSGPKCCNRYHRHSLPCCRQAVLGMFSTRGSVWGVGIFESVYVCSSSCHCTALQGDGEQELCVACGVTHAGLCGLEDTLAPHRCRPEGCQK